jgi:CHRD domain
MCAWLVALLTASGAPAMALADEIVVRLVGYQETPQTLNSAGSATLVARISEDGTSIEYRLSYSGLADVLQSHIHFGSPATSGGVALFLCTNLGNAPASVPTPPACPPPPATVTGTLTAANVIALPGQGIEGGAAGFAEVLRAIRAGAAYANVHTTAHPGGELRGRLSSD